jgi:hypothetical protein
VFPVGKIGFSEGFLKFIRRFFGFSDGFFDFSEGFCRFSNAFFAVIEGFFQFSKPFFEFSKRFFPFSERFFGFRNRFFGKIRGFFGFFRREKRVSEGKSAKNAFFFEVFEEKGLPGACPRLISLVQALNQRAGDGSIRYSGSVLRFRRLLRRRSPATIRKEAYGQG